MLQKENGAWPMGIMVPEVVVVDRRGLKCWTLSPCLALGTRLRHDDRPPRRRDDDDDNFIEIMSIKGQSVLLA